MFGGVPASDIEGAERPYDRPQFDGDEPRMFDPHAPQERMFDRDEHHEPAPHGDFSEPMLEPASGLDESHSAVPQERRAPPPPVEDDLEFEEEAEEEARPPRSYRNLIKGAVAALVFIVVGGLLLWQWPNMVALYSSFRAPAVETVRDYMLPEFRNGRYGAAGEHATENHRSHRARHPAGPGNPGARRGARRRSGAEGGALRRGPRRPQRQALRRIGHLADRDRDAGAGAASRACDPCRRRGAGAQAGNDLLVPPQHRQGPAGHPYCRDHVQAARGLSRWRSRPAACRSQVSRSRSHPAST